MCACVYACVCVRMCVCACVCACTRVCGLYSDTAHMQDEPASAMISLYSGKLVAGKCIF